MSLSKTTTRRRIKNVSNKFTPETLKEMLQLRALGWSSGKLGKKYSVDHTTILFQCKRHAEMVARGEAEEVSMSGIFNDVSDVSPLVVETAKTMREMREKKNRKHKYDHIINETINQGRMYREYLKTAY